ncbi:hydrolase [Microbacterium sp. PMB16]|uniref:hydrolase n=1 Tax=Microbacterium sp. PMB16 TaxID=3120157 RepID=UPI003F4BA8C4
MKAATFFDGGGWREGVVEIGDGGRMLLREVAVPDDFPRLDGVITGGFTDHHVHLQLVDHTLLTDSVLGRVVDLGANPEAIARLAVHDSVSSSPGRPSAPGPGQPAEVLAELCTPPVAIEFAGAFLTPPGGYPSDRDWAPAGSFREVASTEEAAAAVAEMAAAGASLIKLASNSDASPVFDDDLFRAIIDLAAERSLPVVVHTQGPGQAQRAARLGATTLAHAPFTERLTDDEIAEQAASVTWISTLAIHDGAEYRTAVDNVRRFHAAGGIVLYGTDMGNGPTPVGLNPREIAALRESGIDGLDLLRLLAPADPRDPASALFLLPGDADPLRARRLSPADLKV